MPLLSLLTDFFAGRVHGGGFVSRLCTMISQFADRVSLPAEVFWVLGIAILLTVGLLGLRLSRWLLAFLGGLLGYAAGCELFYLTATSIDGIPLVFEYVFGALIAILFLEMVLFQKRLSWCLLVFGVALAVLLPLLPQMPTLCVAGAVLLALICGLLPRTTLSIGIGYLCSVFIMAFLFRLFPTLPWLSVGESYAANAIAAAFGIVLALLQLLCTCRLSRKEKKEKRIKTKKIKVRKKKKAQTV